MRLGDLPAVDAQPRPRRSVLLIVAEDNRLHGPPSRASFFGQVDFFSFDETINCIPGALPGLYMANHAVTCTGSRGICDCTPNGGVGVYLSDACREQHSVRSIRP